MKIAQLKIKGFRSFGPTETILKIDPKLVAFIGLNSSGKTTALDALRKLFGSNSSEREIYQNDFHFDKDEAPNSITEKKLSIEVKLEFSDDDEDSIASYFSQMVIDEEDGDPYIRIRLEATWKQSDAIPDGEINNNLYFIKVADGEDEDEDSKQFYSSHLKYLIQIIYVPAIRRPAEQLKYATGSILYRVLRKIKWQEDFKNQFDTKIEEINEEFKKLPELQIIQSSITSFWEQFHKDERYKETTFGFGGSDFDAILKKIEVSFTPSPTHRKFSVDDLGEGYRSLFYLTLVCALLDIEEKFADQEDQEHIGLSRPLLTILAIEEPENHIAPQLLGRVIKILETIAEKDACQVLLSSHTPAIVKRLEPESIFHFRITAEYKTEVNIIKLPEETDEAYKYIKEAIRNYPEIYFAKLVVIGEGDSEDVIFDRLMDVMGVDFDDNLITFAPLGHRFVNHIWTLLKALHIPYITLLDLDNERNGGGWGRVNYAIKQLLAVGVKKKDILTTGNGTILTDEELDDMHTWPMENATDLKRLLDLADFLKRWRVYYSAPLDLDFLMLKHYIAFYKKAIPESGGPRIPDKGKKLDEFQKKVTIAIQATLKYEEATAVTYTDEEKELMIWYNYHFLGRGKPATHIQALSLMSDRQIKATLPSVFGEIFNKISEILNK